jgi:hypothetical protein
MKGFGQAMTYMDNFLDPRLRHSRTDKVLKMAKKQQMVDVKEFRVSKFGKSL